MKYILYLLITMFGTISYAHTLQSSYIHNTVNNAKTYDIQKDANGFMWFLHDDGINRFDGKNLKQYILDTQDAFLFLDSHNIMKGISLNGNLFYYDAYLDCYKMERNLGKIDHIYGVNNNHLWFGYQDKLYLYNLDTKKTYSFMLSIGHVYALSAISNDEYFIGTSVGLFHFYYKNGKLKLVKMDLSDGKCRNIECLYYDKIKRRLFIQDRATGINVYDWNTKELLCIKTNILSSEITCIHSFDKQYIMIVTNKAAIYLMNISDYTYFLYTNMDIYNNGNTHQIRDVWVDEQKRIWMADYKTGVIMIDEILIEYKKYRDLNQASPSSPISVIHSSHCIDETGYHPENKVYTAIINDEPFVWNECKMCNRKYTPIYLDELFIHGHPVHVGMDNSPLKQSLQYTKILKLSYRENTFTIKAISPMYDYSPQLLYTWKLENGDWSVPSIDGTITCHNLHPGIHHIHIRTLSAETGTLVAQRNIKVIVHPPFWRTSGIYIMCSLVSCFLGWSLLKKINPASVQASIEILDDKEELDNSATNPEDIEFIEKVDSFLEENISISKVNIDLIAQSIPMSRSAFYNKMRAITQMAPKDYSLRYKMRKAVDMLLSGEDIQINEMNYQLGFSDAKYFSSVFKKHYGISPSDYKKIHKKTKHR